MVRGADGAYYVDAASAVAGAKASAAGVFSSTPDNENAIFGNYGGNTAGSGLPELPTVAPVPKNGIGSDPTGIIGWVDKTFPSLGAMDSIVGMNPNTPGSGVGGALKFITDIPRVATTLLGLILIIAGIFALSRGPAVNIVSSAVRGAVTS